MWKEKLGNSLFVTSLVKDLEDVRWLIYLLSLVVAALLFFIGVTLLKEKDNKKGKE